MSELLLPSGVDVAFNEIEAALVRQTGTPAKRAGTASLAATQQTAALDNLSATSRKLAELSVRLRRSISHFEVSAGAPVQVPAPDRPPGSGIPSSPSPSPAARTRDAALAAR